MVEETKGAKKKIGAVRSSAIGETPFVETIPQIFCPLGVAPNTISRDSHPLG
jgi:hypothetical protein